MRNASAVAALVIGLAIAVALAGCLQPPPPVIPTAEPTAAPVFTSDAAALAAAKKAYVAYVAASDAIGNDGGSNPQRIAQWVTPSRLKTETKEFDAFSKTGEHLEGKSVISHFALQQVDQSQSGVVTISAYVCDDVSASRLIDGSGLDVTPSARREVVPLQVNLRNLSAGSHHLVIEGSTPWSGSDFC
jgi:hypothetical protein